VLFVVSKISELKAGISDAHIKGEVVEVAQPRSVQTKYGPNVVSNVMVQDKSGKIKLVLWAKQIEQVKKGNTVEVKGGYVTEWQGELQLNIGRAGEMIVT